VGVVGSPDVSFRCYLQLPKFAPAGEPASAAQVFPPVLGPEQAGEPPLMEQNEEQVPVPTMRQVLPGMQSLA
jgi:hypothetical protein